MALKRPPTRGPSKAARVAAGKDPLKDFPYIA